MGIIEEQKNDLESALEYYERVGKIKSLFDNKETNYNSRNLNSIPRLDYLKNPQFHHRDSLLFRANLLYNHKRDYKAGRRLYEEVLMKHYKHDTYALAAIGNHYHYMYKNERMEKEVYVFKILESSIF